VSSGAAAAPRSARNKPGTPGLFRVQNEAKSDPLRGKVQYSCNRHSQQSQQIDSLTDRQRPAVNFVCC
jgi:hypothetical protein